MIRVAYILKMYPRFSETFIVNEILELERQGVEVCIYSLRLPDDGRFHPALSRVKAHVTYVPQYPEMEPDRVRAAHAKLASVNPEAYQEMRTYAESLSQPYGLKRFLQAGMIAAHLLDHPVDALHAHFASSATRVANFVTRLTGIPYSFTAHAKDIFHEEVSPTSLQGKIRDARFVVTVSQFNKNFLRDLQNGESGDVRRLYNGIDLSQFCPDTAVARQPNLILGVGRLVEKKGFDYLIEACAILAQRGVDFQCEIVGKGALHQPLQQLIEARQLTEQVRLVGPLPQDGVLAAYKRASIFILPCIIGKDGNRDGLPTVLLEAMATGLPAVSTDVTGNPEIIDDGVSGFIVPPEEAAALADALQQLLQDAQLRRRMGEAARQKVEIAFDVQKNVGQLHQWLAEPATAVSPSRPSEDAIFDIEALLPELPPVPRLEEVFA